MGLVRTTAARLHDLRDRVADIDPVLPPIVDDDRDRAAAQGSGAGAGRAATSAGWIQLRRLLGQRARPVVILMVASVVTGLTEAGILAMLAQIATGLVGQSSRVKLALGPIQATERLGWLVVAALILALIRLALQGVISSIPARIAADLTARLRQDLFAAFTYASWSRQSRDRDGHLQDLLTNQITWATVGALQTSALIVALMSFLVLVAVAFALNVLAAFVVLIAAGLLFLLMRPLSSLGTRYSRAASRASLAYAGGVNEAVRLAEEIQVFGVDAALRTRVNTLVMIQRRLALVSQFLARFVPGAYQSAIYLLIVGALGVLYLSGAHHVASLGAVVLLLVRAGSYGQQVQAAHQQIRQALPYVERLTDVQRHYANSRPAPGPRSLDIVEAITCENVSFAYQPGQPVLSEITFTAKSHETVGIVGPTGAGKSTLVQILLRLREPSSGRYLVNGVPAESFAREEWTHAIAYLPQEPRLLHASVSDNIRFFRELDDASVQAAARLAGIHADVVSWPNGYDTIIGPRADAVSGGQQQRICLARALAARPQVLVLDEPTSALDPQTELLIQKSLIALKHELTLFLVAHRMSTLDICDRVMVIVDGRIQAFAAADVLARNSIYYRSVSSSRLTKPAAR